MSFLEEIKRRKVIRVGVTYLIAAWLLLQVADVLLDPLKVPQWFMTALIVLVALGFPFALIMAWAFDLRCVGGFCSVRIHRPHGICPAAL